MKFMILTASLLLAANVSANTEEWTMKPVPKPSSITKPAKPEVSKPEVSKPEVSKPEVSKPEVSKPEVSKPEVSKPEVSKPEVSKPEVSKPEVSKPEVSKPEVSKPEVSKPVVQKIKLKSIIYGQSMDVIEKALVNEVLAMKQGNYFHAQSGRKCARVSNIQFGYSEAGSSYKITKDDKVVASKKSFGWITFSCLNKSPYKK